MQIFMHGLPVPCIPAHLNCQLSGPPLVILPGNNYHGLDTHFLWEINSNPLRLHVGSGLTPARPIGFRVAINQVHGALVRISGGHSDAQPEPLKPAVSVKKSITPDYIVCLEDGKKFKSLKRHLRTQYNMTPEQYREKWGLPADYPMVAPNYAVARSQLAKKMGLGQQRPRRK